MTHSAFIIKASLGSPISFRNPISFDSLVLAGRFASDPETFGRPLDCIAMRDGVYRASVGFVEGVPMLGVQETVHARPKRLHLIGRDGDETVIPTGKVKNAASIDNKSLMRPQLNKFQVYTHASAIYWQAFGDAEQCLEYLWYVNGVGAMRNCGYGSVTEWSVLDCDASDDEAGLFGASGQPIRKLPRAWARTEPSSEILVDRGRMEPPFALSDDVEDLMILPNSYVIGQHDRIAQELKIA